MPKSAKHAKAKKAIHPNSRKAHKIGAKEIHNEKIKKVHRETSLKQSVLREKLMWVKEHLDEEKVIYSKIELCELVESYLDRFEEELEQINIIQGVSGRKSNQHASRESAIKLTLDKETTDYQTCGIEMPDLCNGKIMKIFKNWEGEVKYLQNIKLCRVKKMPETGSKPSDVNLSEKDDCGSDEDDKEEDQLEDLSDNSDNCSKKVDDASNKDEEGTDKT